MREALLDRGEPSVNVRKTGFNVVLALLFYGLFAPLGLLLRTCGRDALGLSLQPEADSYWAKKEACTDKHRYLQQF